MHLCPIDLHKLQTAVGFGVLKQHQSLLDFYIKHEFDEERDWMKNRLEAIRKGPTKETEETKDNRIRTRSQSKRLKS